MKIISFIKYLFTAFGLGMLILSFFEYKVTQDFLIEAVSTEGTVVELVRTKSEKTGGDLYSPRIEFETNNGAVIELSPSVASNPPSYSIGEVVGVLYQEPFPERAKINDLFSLWGGTIISCFLGVIFFLIGSSLILIGHLKGRKKQYLKNSGITVKTKFQSVEINSSINVNDRHPYNIYSQWINPDTSELHIFKSEDIWFDPSDYINLTEITVFIEKENPHKYYVDISFLPKLAS